MNILIKNQTSKIIYFIKKKYPFYFINIYNEDILKNTSKLCNDGKIIILEMISILMSINNIKYISKFESFINPLIFINSFQSSIQQLQISGANSFLSIIKIFGNFIYKCEELKISDYIKNIIIYSPFKVKLAFFPVITEFVCSVYRDHEIFNLINQEVLENIFLLELDINEIEKINFIQFLLKIKDITNKSDPIFNLVEQKLIELN